MEASLSSSEDESSQASSEEKEKEATATLPRPNKKSRLTAAPLEVAAAPVVSSTANSGTRNRNQQPIIILLDQATIETVKNKRNVYELLNCDDHRELCRRKLHQDPNDHRPDILHQEMLALLDSPLNKAGLLKLYVKTKRNVLIEVNPSIRIPRTYKRFAGLMVQLLHKMKIKAGTESTTLLKVVQNPFSQYLPAGTRCYGMSCRGRLYSPLALAQQLVPDAPSGVCGGGTDTTTSTPPPPPPPTCFIVGAMSTGHILLEDHPYMEKMFSISSYPLSGAAALSRIAGAIEHHWGIV